MILPETDINHLDDASQDSLDQLHIDGELYNCIANSHLLPTFWMSLVGADDHWMFIASNGALSAGRRNPDLALFPYAPDDQILAARHTTGPITLIGFSADGFDGELKRQRCWEPFGARQNEPFQYRRNLYKNSLGTKLVFEEVNEDLDLTFRYRWCFSRRFGFVRTATLVNNSKTTISLELLDGLQNVLPHGVGQDFLTQYSNLANAYKKCELVETSNLGLFYLSSIPTDKAEPSEGLKTNVVWQCGLSPSKVMLSSGQNDLFRKSQNLSSEIKVRGKPGAYLAFQQLTLDAGESLKWHVVAELAQDHCDVVALDRWLKSAKDPAGELKRDIDESEERFLKIVASSDAIQVGSNRLRNDRHLSNTIFNVMRGGVPVSNYRIHADDFRAFVRHSNQVVAIAHSGFLSSLPDEIDVAELRAQAESVGDPDLLRLASEYLPLAFSRRHGDPTRPWNRFSIELKSDTERTSLNYQGNWRDIFQNWEALGFSFPQFLPAMICRFVNATTADGYNPYRLTSRGFEWEEPAPEDPWANIGYWGDHQIIYLLKLLESGVRFEPCSVKKLLNVKTFVHANVPYRIRDYEAIKSNPQDTIQFDENVAAIVSHRVSRVGSDGKLVWSGESIHHVTLLEKLLTLSLAKLSNFVPDGGIWLNTQRPEWNDANNALVGNGLSMVTTNYLYRWFKFLQKQLAESDDASFDLSQPVASFLKKIRTVLESERPHGGKEQDEFSRARIVDALSQAGSEYRETMYAHGFGEAFQTVSRDDCLSLFENAVLHLDATIRNNKRDDGLYHSYNLLSWNTDGVHVEHLYEMLEGQVAVLCSGLLDADEIVQLLDALCSSRLYRANQNSYLLYPDRELPAFLDKNRVPVEAIDANPLLRQLLQEGNTKVVARDVLGDVHFNGSFRNSADLVAAMRQLSQRHQPMVREHGQAVAELFEDVFGHSQFTGRSGTFFGYEGLGSIYWHMVSKLVLAVAENHRLAIDANADDGTICAIRNHYYALRRGIGAEKSPKEYGAFPTDPYSHTPENSGVKQPGMTGQVKEDFLSRFMELGVRIESGCLSFQSDLFDSGELVQEKTTLQYFDLENELRQIEVPEGSIGFTLFQVPVIYQRGTRNGIKLVYRDGDTKHIDGLDLDSTVSEQLFARSGEVIAIHCFFESLNS